MFIDSKAKSYQITKKIVLLFIFSTIYLWPIPYYRHHCIVIFFELYYVKRHKYFPCLIHLRFELIKAKQLCRAHLKEVNFFFFKVNALNKFGIIFYYLTIYG